MALTAYSELEAVNLILRNMGETSVNSLSNPPLDASEALATLQEVSREVQKRGWYFNTEILSLSPDNNGHILLPANTIAVESAGVHRFTRVVMRGGKLYRLEPFNNGPVFDGPMHVKLTLGLDFNDLPPSASSYIAHRAARIMQVREVGDQLSTSEDNQDEQRAFAELHAEQLSAEKLSLKTSIHVQDVVGARFSIR